MHGGGGGPSIGFDGPGPSALGAMRSKRLKEGLGLGVTCHSVSDGQQHRILHQLIEQWYRGTQQKWLSARAWLTWLLKPALHITGVPPEGLLRPFALRPPAASLRQPAASRQSLAPQRTALTNPGSPSGTPRRSTPNPLTALPLTPAAGPLATTPCPGSRRWAAVRRAVSCYR
jgi:hypothetical protein